VSGGPCLQMFTNVTL